METEHKILSHVHFERRDQQAGDPVTGPSTLESMDLHRWKGMTIAGGESTQQTRARKLEKREPRRRVRERERERDLANMRGGTRPDAREEALQAIHLCSCGTAGVSSFPCVCC